MKSDKKILMYMHLSEIMEMLKDIILHIEDCFEEYDDGIKWVEEE